MTKKKMKVEPSRTLVKNLSPTQLRCIKLILTKNNQLFESGLDTSVDPEHGFYITVSSRSYETMKELYIDPNQHLLTMDDDDPRLRATWNEWVIEAANDLKRMIKAAKLVRVFGFPVINWEDDYEPRIEFPKLGKGIEIIPDILETKNQSILGERTIQRQGYKLCVWKTDSGSRNNPPETWDTYPYENAILSEVLTYMVSEYYGNIFNGVAEQICYERNPDEP
jgi:hypothetical protein